MGLYYDTKGAYDAIIAQLALNTNDIISIYADQAIQDANITDNLEMIEGNEDSIQSLFDEIDALAQAISEGGVIVNRKIGAVADVPFSPIEAKVAFPNTINETNESSVITFDANNDHVLITKGQYSISAQLVLQNTSGQARSVTLKLIAKDLVTLVETQIDTTGVINITANETVNIFPQFTYDKISDNNIVIFVRQSGEAEVNLKDTSSLNVNTIFTVAGTGVPTTSRNVAPYEAALEGLLGTEATLNEVNKGFKARFDSIRQAITGSGNDLNMTNNGRITNVADPVSDQDVVTKKYFVDNPTGIPYVTVNMAPSVQADESVDGTLANQSLINKEYTNKNKRQTFAITPRTNVTSVGGNVGAEIVRYNKLVFLKATITTTTTFSIGQALFDTSNAFIGLSDPVRGEFYDIASPWGRYKFNMAESRFETLETTPLPAGTYVISVVFETSST